MYHLCAILVHKCAILVPKRYIGCRAATEAALHAVFLIAGIVLLHSHCCACNSCVLTVASAISRFSQLKRVRSGSALLIQRQNRFGVIVHLAKVLQNLRCAIRSSQNDLSTGCQVRVAAQTPIDHSRSCLSSGDAEGWSQRAALRIVLGSQRASQRCIL